MNLSRRSLLISASAAAFLSAVPSLSRAVAAGGPPVPRIDPVTETFYGVAVTDPYRWMENPDDPEILLGALRRNLFGTDEAPADENLRWFSQYVRNKAAFLTQQSWTNLSQGIISFEGSSDEQKHTGTATDPRMVA